MEQNSRRQCLQSMKPGSYLTLDRRSRARRKGKTNISLFTMGKKNVVFDESDLGCFWLNSKLLHFLQSLIDLFEADVKFHRVAPIVYHQILIIQIFKSWHLINYSLFSLLVDDWAFNKDNHFLSSQTRLILHQLWIVMKLFSVHNHSHINTVSQSRTALKIPFSVADSTTFPLQF